MPRSVEIEVWGPQTISYSLAYPLNINMHFILVGTLRRRIYPHVTKLGILTYIGLLHVPAKFHHEPIYTSRYMDFGTLTLGPAVVSIPLKIQNAKKN